MSPFKPAFGHAPSPFLAERTRDVWGDTPSSAASSRATCWRRETLAGDLRGGTGVKRTVRRRGVEWGPHRLADIPI